MLKINRKFFERDTAEVAHDLIGKTLVRMIDFMGKYYKLSGTIVETEAYGSNNDPASHAFKKKTNRNWVMYDRPGKIYIYFIYGNHYCFNIVAKNYENVAGAILIRAIQPLEGINLMKIFRKTANINYLASGPGKLTQAFKISKKHNGVDITDSKNDFLFLEEEISQTEIKKFKVLETKRIGLTHAIDKQWRFIMLDPTATGKDHTATEFVPNSYLSKRG
ncbi:MAG: DNA-3-methyladenine glycosylase [Candidatus Nitrosocosmicus sp.]